MNTALEQAATKPITYTPTGGTQSVKLTVNMVKEFLCKPTKKGALCDTRDAMRFVMLCSAKGLNPWEGDAFLVGYDGQKGPEFSLITSHQAFLKRAEVAPHFDGMTSGVTVEETPGNYVDLQGDFHNPKHTLVAGWAKIHFKDRKHPVYRRVKLQRFAKDNKFWNADQAGMIVKCAESDALRSAFPTLLGGLYTRAESDAGAAIDIDATVGAAMGAQKELGQAPVEPQQASPEPEGEHSPAKPKRVRRAPSAKEELQPQTGAPTPQEELASIVGAEGFSFDDFRAMAGEIGILSDPTACGSWAEVPAVEAERCIRAKKGLLDGLRTAKGAA